MALADAQAGAFLLGDGQHSSATLFESVGLGQDMLADYNNEFGRLDPNLQFKLKHPEQDCLVDRRDLPRETVKLGAFHQEFMRRHGLYTSMALTLSSPDTDLISSFSVHRHLGHSEFDDESIQWAQRTLPHLRRAVTMNRKFQHLLDTAAYSKAALDAFALPVLLLDERGKVLLMNRAAIALSASVPALRVEHGRLATTFISDLPCGKHLLRRPGNPVPLNVFSVPVAPQSALAEPWGGPCSMLLVEDPADAPPHLPSLLTAMYGLTQAEARVCIAVASTGLSPQECADTFGVTIHTVRSQIKAVLSKTGVRRGAELSNLVHVLRLVRS